MAKSKNTTQHSVIAILARKRDALFQAAEADGVRTLTEAEHCEAEALATVIATLPSVGRQDARAQITVARDLVELVQNGLAGAGRLELACAALASATRAMGSRKRAA